MIYPLPISPNNPVKEHRGAWSKLVEICKQENPTTEKQIQRSYRGPYDIFEQQDMGYDN